jgi:hypothetical protein
MTIQEAIKSGKPFKRKGWRRYRYIQKTDKTMLMRICEYPLSKMYYTPSIKIGDILADDWVTESDG